MGKLGAALHIGGDLVPVALGHVDVGQDDVGGVDVEAIYGQLTVSDRRDFDVFVGERELDDALNRHAVIGEKKLMCHRQSYQSWCLSA